MNSGRFYFYLFLGANNEFWKSKKAFDDARVGVYIFPYWILSSIKLVFNKTAKKKLGFWYYREEEDRCKSRVIMSDMYVYGGTLL